MFGLDIGAGGMRYNKIKVGRVSGYPVTVTQGKSELEAILIGCDDDVDPQVYISRAINGRDGNAVHLWGRPRPRPVDPSVMVRWSVAGYDDVVPVSSVRLRPPERQGWSGSDGKRTLRPTATLHSGLSHAPPSRDGVSTMVIRRF